PPAGLVRQLEDGPALLLRDPEVRGRPQRQRLRDARRRVFLAAGAPGSDQPIGRAGGLLAGEAALDGARARGTRGSLAGAELHAAGPADDGVPGTAHLPGDLAE